MDALSAAAALITLAALFSWLNHKYIRQPQSIALIVHDENTRVRNRISGLRV
jgi:hypothetical protein